MAVPRVALRVERSAGLMDSKMAEHSDEMKAGY